MTRQSRLEEFGDAEGSIAFGWVDDGVLYARFSGGLSASLGTAHAARLQAFAREADSIHYFCDTSALKHYDLLARSAFVRVVMANRRSFKSLVFYMWGNDASPAANAFAGVLGEGVELCFDAGEFEARLYRAAPAARSYLDPKTWLRRPVTVSKT